MDVYCAKCKEPWDGSLQDMDTVERSRFRAGEGCPSCGFGTRCPACSGSGKERAKYGSDCEVCRGQRGFVIYRLLFEKGPYFVGYHPRHRIITEQEYRKIYQLPNSRSRDGLVEEWWCGCEACRDTAPTCTECNGDGKLHRGESTDAFLGSMLEASDEPDSILRAFIRNSNVGDDEISQKGGDA